MSERRGSHFRVAVVVTAGGDAELLAATIESVLTQTAEPHEVVVVPLGADPAPVTHHPERVQVLASAEGVAAARNRATRATTAPYLVFLEAGDRLLPGALEAGVRCLEQRPVCAFAYGRCARPPGDVDLAESQAARRVTANHYVELLRGDFLGTSAVAVYRRSAVEHIGGHDPSLQTCAVHDLHLRLAREYPVHFHGKPVAAECGRGSGEADPVEAARESLRLLRAQRDRVRGNPHYERAYAEGADQLAVRHGLVVAAQLREQVRGRRRVGAARAALAVLRFAVLLLRTHPAGLRAFVAAELVPWLRRRWPVRQPGTPAPADRVMVPLHIEHVRQVIRATVPRGATVLVLGGIGEDVSWDGRRAVAVRPEADGTSLSGGDYLLVPSMAFWDFEHHHCEFARRLTATAVRVWSDDRCLLYRLADDRPAEPPPSPSRVLVAGHFSFEHGRATAGDLLARDLLCDWLDDAGRPYNPFPGGVDWRTVDPTGYDCVVFVCGPFVRSPGLADFLTHFAGRRLVGVNLSMLAPLSEWNPFDALIERDSSAVTRPDLTFLSRRPPVPVVGVCLREHAGGTRTTDAAVRRLVGSREMSLVSIDTRLDASGGIANSSGLRSPSEVESLLARMDVVITTRLHGMVLALKNGVPAVAIDPGSEGYKIQRQAQAVGWPVVFDVRTVTDEALQDALRYCLTEDARAEAARCAARAADLLAAVRDEVLDAL